MVAAFNDVQLGARFKALEYGRKLRGSAERVPRPLYDQHRPLYVRQVGVPEPIGTARRMERVAEQNEAADGWPTPGRYAREGRQHRSGGGDMCGGAAAH